MLRRLHLGAALMASFLVAAFMTATLAVELLGGAREISVVKSTIAWSLLVLVPALMATGLSGYRLGRGRVTPRVECKMARMRLIAALGLGVLAPSAVFLALSAQAHVFDIWFSIAQGCEFLAGAANLVLIGLNLRDGLAMARQRKRAAQFATSL